MTERGRRATLIIGSVVVTLLLFTTGLELFLRIQYARWKREVRDQVLGTNFGPSPDPVLLWENRSGYVGDDFRINRWGFRDVDSESRTKPPDTYRIAFVGDSVTFGAFVTDEERFVNLFGREVSTAGGRPVQALNVSVSGYDALQVEELVSTKTIPFEPDLVVYVLCLNDFDFEGASGDLKRYFRPPRSFVWDRLSHLDEGFRAHEYHQAAFSRHRNEVYDAIRRMRAGLAQHGVTFEVVVLPVFDRSVPAFDAYPFAAIHESIDHFLDEIGVRGIDLLRTFRACGTRAPWAYSHDVWHPNALGHRFIAHALSELVLPTSGRDVVSGRTCAELRDLEPSAAPEAARQIAGRLSNGEAVLLALNSPLVRLSGFWGIERGNQGIFSWSRDRNTVELSHLEPGVKYRIALRVADAGGCTRVEVGPAGSSLETIAVDGPELRVPTAVTAGDDGHATVDLRVETWQPSARGGKDTRTLGIALSALMIQKAN